MHAHGYATSHCLYADTNPDRILYRLPCSVNHLQLFDSWIAPGESHEQGLCWGACLQGPASPASPLCRLHCLQCLQWCLQSRCSSLSDTQLKPFFASCSSLHLQLAQVFICTQLKPFILSWGQLACSMRPRWSWQSCKPDKLQLNCTCSAGTALEPLPCLT